LARPPCSGGWAATPIAQLAVADALNTSLKDKRRVQPHSCTTVDCFWVNFSQTCRWSASHGWTILHPCELELWRGNKWAVESRITKETKIWYGWQERSSTKGVYPARHQLCVRCEQASVCCVRTYGRKSVFSSSKRVLDVQTGYTQPFEEGHRYRVHPRGFLKSATNVR
jgi:hypothetical protein